jgi:hypothetical protein
MKIKKTLTPADYFLLLANLVPLYGVWYLNWKAIDVFVVYALETLVAGFFTILKLGTATVVRKTDEWVNGDSHSQVSGLFFILFFIAHFGLFAAVQTSIFSETAGIIPEGKGMLYFFFHWYRFINPDIAIMLSVFSLTYAIRNLLPFLANKEYKTTSMTRLMFEPYGRIFIQQFTVILGSMLLTFHLGKLFVLVFACIKIFFEVFLNMNEIIKDSVEKQEKQSGQ